SGRGALIEGDMTEAVTATPGRRLAARYILHERLGVGGQGEVWRAHDPERGVDIALKILQPSPGRVRAGRGVARTRSRARSRHCAEDPATLAGTCRRRLGRAPQRAREREPPGPSGDPQGISPGA